MFGELENLHHAIIVTGNRQGNLVLVKKYLAEQGVVLQGNPDVMIYEDEQILMEMAQGIVQSVTSQKISDHRFVIVSCARMATDVQNRFLKTFEEPQPGTYFFILVPSVDMLLPTILSRCQVVVGDQSTGETRLDTKKFLKSTMVERFTQVEEWTKNKKDENNLTKSEVVHFLDQVEKIVWEAGVRDEQFFSDIRKMREYANIRGASHRVILDFIAMVTPVLK